MNEYPNQQFLVETEWLHRHLEDDDLRIIDSSLTLVPDPKTTYRIESGLDSWRSAHIPGSCYVDIQEELSQQGTGLRFTFPPADLFAEVATGKGISSNSNVVIYATNSFMWATRLWYMFRAFGMQRVAVLNGGLAKWSSEGRQVSSAESPHARGKFTATFNPARLSTKEQILGIMDDDDVCVLNSLSREQHRGEGPHYGRPGRIKGSANVPARELMEPETGVVKSAAELRALFDDVGALDARQVVTYCGGGIAATATAFALALLGHEQRVSLYDASMSEWANDPDAPMDTG
ncbi:MAG: sulfurtransferase [Pseudomonadales bacterium]|jgi:thiosulfate/3-mercaptopyruvate sulfurtransferase|nr:sulfurtransferase [Pseudomonadales bacterium]MDP7597906.1 sulfurtransferase [Pseudomonadales bacterium]HJN51941.1 sulfurtransferase [Pseudomonadales bacterium]|tara:strand:- start:59 stop:931 length:873 start_codon:yes stop_codon:yes gene_type:complete